LRIYDSVKYKELIEDCKLNEIYNEFNETVIKNINLEKLVEKKEENKIIDRSHHNIRYASLLLNLQMAIVSNENRQNKSGDVKRQIFAIFTKISETIIERCSTWQHYNKEIYKEKGIRKIPLLQFSDKGRDYILYYNIIKEFVKNIQEKLKKSLRMNIIPIFCPYECVILYYMMEIQEHGEYSKITITDIYNITDIYYKSYDNLSQSHDKCICNKCFHSDILKKSLTENDKQVTSLKKYIQIHYEKITKMNEIYLYLCNEYPNVNWLCNHVIKYNGKNGDYKIHKQFTMIGYEDNNAIIVYIKPNLNSLNYNDTIIESLYDTFLLTNVKKYKDEEETIESDNYIRFNGKNITTVVFCPEFDKPYYIRWKSCISGENLIETNKNIILRTLRNKLIEKFFIDSKTIYSFYKYWRYNRPDEITTPLDLMYYIQKKYNNIKEKNETDTKKFPNFISEFLNNIIFSIQNCKEKKSKIIKEYDDSEYFMGKMKDMINDSVNRFFGIKNEDNEYISDEDEDVL
jgi:hypothetical protein